MSTRSKLRELIGVELRHLKTIRACDRVWQMASPSLLIGAYLESKMEFAVQWNSYVQQSITVPLHREPKIGSEVVWAATKMRFG